MKNLETPGKTGRVGKFVGPWMEPDSLGFLTLITKLQSHLALSALQCCAKYLWSIYVKVKGEGAHDPKAQMFGAYPSFISMKQLGVLLRPPGRDNRRVTPQQYVAGTHLYTWVKREKVE